MSITRCALAVITDRGHSVVAPTLSELDPAETDFLERHIDELRSQVSAGDARGRFRASSNLEIDIATALAGDEAAYLAVASRLVDQLATSMRSVHTTSCVVALVAQVESGESRLTLLKLDAEIEAAQLEQTADGIRLRVFDDLLPSPGDIQKGLSWPDPRAPDSELIVLDRVRRGSAARYFQTAFGLYASPRPKDTEDALMVEISILSPLDAETALSVVGDGGPADQVVARIREAVPSFSPTAQELVPHEGIAGFIRPAFDGTSAVKFEADGIQVSVPLRKRGSIQTVREGTGFVTTIRTSTPLTPITHATADSN